MARPIMALASYSKQRLFEEIAAGIPLIMRNAEHLRESSERVRLAEANRASNILRGFADEEAAKVLILLDVVRASEDSMLKANTLKNFSSHLAKRIYTLVCSYPNIQSFGELTRLVDLERRANYLDGPNDVDWILPNSIHTERERELYVDYMEDITEQQGGRFWVEPSISDDPEVLSYHRSDTLHLCRALCDIGATSKDGLAAIADVWKGFRTEHDTCRSEVHKTIRRMLNHQDVCRDSTVDEETKRIIIHYWTFPLWSLSPIRLDDRTAVEDLRVERKRTMQWIHEKEARRDPPPDVAREKVEALHQLYMEWRSEVEENYAHKHPDSAKHGGPPVFRSAEDIADDFRLPSHMHLENMFKSLTESERRSLLALGWFTRDRVADWPWTFNYAQERFSGLDDDYQIGLAGSWLSGFNRWDRPPERFSAGSNRR